MEKLFAVLYSVIVALSILCGFLLLQVSDLQSQNGVLEDHINEYQNQIGQLENQTSELENQIEELEKQTSELEDQIEELEQQLEEPTYEQKLSDAQQVIIETFWTEYGIRIMGAGGGEIRDVFYISIRNYASRDVEGLTVLVMSTLGSTDIIHNDTITIDVLEARSAKTVSVAEKVTDGTWTFWNIKIDEITLLWDEVVIDERIVP